MSDTILNAQIDSEAWVTYPCFRIPALKAMRNDIDLFSGMTHLFRILGESYASLLCTIAEVMHTSEATHLKLYPSKRSDVMQ